MSHTGNVLVCTLHGCICTVNFQQSIMVVRLVRGLHQFSIYDWPCSRKAKHRLEIHVRLLRMPLINQIG